MSLLIGSIVGIYKDVFIVAKVTTGGWNLINLRNGHRYTDTNFPIRDNSNVVSNSSQQHYIESHNILPSSFRILSSSLESLLNTKKKPDKRPEDTSNENLYREFVQLLTTRYASTTMAGSLGRTRTHLYFDIVSGPFTTIFINTLQGIDDVSILDSVIANGFCHIEIPFSRIDGLLRGDYGPI